MRTTELRRSVGNRSKPQPGSRLRVVEGTTTEVAQLWTASPFTQEGDVPNLDTIAAIVETFQPVIPASCVSKLLAHSEGTSKPGPAPIYKDKRVEENWAFLKIVPEIQPDRLPSLSRCPSLMSGVSSRNSSTRSARSSIWDPAEDHKDNVGSVCRASSCNDLCIPEVSTQVQLLHAREQSASRCPVKSCSKNFTRPADRKRHVFRHFTGVLRCGFCTEDDVLFSQSSDRVGLFMTHLIKNHGANGQAQNLGSDVDKLNGELAMLRKGIPRPSFEGPVATCSVCIEPFSAQGFFEHLRGCIFREITRHEETHIGIDSLENSHESYSNDLDVSQQRLHEQERYSVVDESHGAVEYTSYPSLPNPSIDIPDTDFEDIAKLTASSRCLSITSSKAVESSEEETDWTEDQTSRESSPGTSQLPRRLSPAKRKVVETVMHEFQRLFSQSLRTHTSGEQVTSSSSSGWSSNVSIYSTSSFNSRKRSLSGGGGSTPPNGDGDSNKRRRPDSKADGKKSVADLRFACPYYKRNPGRHQTFTSCRDPGFITVARLKEHLYRRHILPPQCHRCCATFSNDVTLRGHQRDPRGCDVREQVLLEGFDKEQERNLKSKKKSQVYQTEEEKWKGVYRILFPDDGEVDIPTPYIEYQPCTGQTAEPANVVRFQEFSRLELPRLVRRTLEAVVEQEAQPLEDKMKERLVDIVKECQSQLFSMFHATNESSANATNSFDAITLIKPMVNAPVAEPSNRATCHGSDRVFDDFDSPSGHDNATSKTSLPSEFELSATGLKLATSSNSSDSGYDSMWLPAQMQDSNADASNIAFHQLAEFTQHDYVDLGGNFGLFHDRTEPMLQCPSSMISTDPCTWSFVEPMPSMSDTVAAIQGQLEGPGLSWQL